MHWRYTSIQAQMHWSVTQSNASTDNSFRFSSQIFHSNVGWSKKWNDLINKSTEYGSVKNAWLNITTEADQLAEIHSELQIRLGNQVRGNVQRWKSDNYHKSLLSWKETKTAEEGFSKAQKPWVKRHDEGAYLLIFCSHLFLLDHIFV